MKVKQLDRMLTLNVERDRHQGASLAVPWLRLCVSIAGGTGSMLGQETKILLHSGHPPPKKKKPQKYQGTYSSLSTSHMLKYITVIIVKETKL